MVKLEDKPDSKASLGSVYRDPEDHPRTHAPHSCLAQVIPRPQATQGGVVAFSFPLHTVSSACRLWRNIARGLPEIWSRLAIFIDENFTPLSKSIVTPNTDEDEEDEDLEQDIEDGSRAVAVMKLLAPLIPRCLSFVFDVKHSSSLPYISQHFRGHAPHLRAPKLQCMIDPPPVPDLPTEEEFTFPLLTAVALDGTTFMDACSVESWQDQLNTLAIDTLSISNFTAPDADEYAQRTF